MKTTILSVAISVLGFLLPVHTRAQTDDHRARLEKKNSLEIFFPVCDFLDGSPTNWSMLSPRITGYGEYEKILPLTFGLQFSRRLNALGSMRASVQVYRKEYPEEWGSENLERGHIFLREFFEGSLGYQRTIFQRGGLGFSGLAEANLRVGNAMVHLHNDSWEIATGRLTYSDLGLSLGLRVEQELPMNFFFSGESKFTRYVFVNPNSKLNSPTPSTLVLPSPNTLAIKLALGYRF